MQVVSSSDIALLPLLAAARSSSCLPLAEAATALCVAWVMARLALIRSSGVAVTVGSCSLENSWISLLMASIELSTALVPRVLSSSKYLTDLRKLVMFCMTPCSKITQ